MDNAIGLIDVLKSAPAYLVVVAAAVALLLPGTSRVFKVDPKHRKVLNRTGIGLAVLAGLLILWGEITKVIGG